MPAPIPWLFKNASRASRFEVLTTKRCQTWLKGSLYKYSYGRWVSGSWRDCGSAVRVACHEIHNRLRFIRFVSKQVSGRHSILMQFVPWEFWQREVSNASQRCDVLRRALSPIGVPLIEMCELGRQYSSLNRIESRVAALHDVMVLLRCSPVLPEPDTLCQFRICFMPCRECQSGSLAFERLRPDE
jgi:hypothetical protein